MANPKALRFTHALDAAWIIALWKAIHGGDPSPEQAAVEAIAALAGALIEKGGGAIPRASLVKLQTRLKEIGVDFQVDTKAGKNIAASVTSRPKPAYCVLVQGKLICIPRPTPFPHPFA